MWRSWRALRRAPRLRLRGEEATSERFGKARSSCVLSTWLVLGRGAGTPPSQTRLDENTACGRPMCPREEVSPALLHGAPGVGVSMLSSTSAAGPP